MRKWWQTWKCTWCGKECDVWDGECGAPGSHSDTACPLGLVAKWKWLRIILSKMKRYLYDY